MKAMILLCGSPASGKTTLAATLEKIWKTMEIEVVVISVDSLQTEELFTPIDWHTAREKATALVEEALTRQSEKTIVLLDDVMEYRSMRRRYYVMAAEKEVAFRLVYIMCPPAVALERNMSRTKGQIPEDVLIKTIERFQPPDGKKMQWEETIVFDAVRLDARSENDCAHLANALLVDWHPAEKGPDTLDRQLRREEGRLANSNVVHQLDVQLRSIISREMRRRQSIDVGDRLAEYARQLNQLRLNCLSAFRDRSIEQTNIDEAVKGFEASIRAEMSMP